MRKRQLAFYENRLTNGANRFTKEINVLRVFWLIFWKIIGFLEFYKKIKDFHEKVIEI